MYMKKLRASDWLKPSVFSYNTNKVVTRVQSYKEHVHTIKIYCDVFSCTLLTNNNMISLAVWR